MWPKAQLMRGSSRGTETSAASWQRPTPRAAARHRSPLPPAAGTSGTMTQTSSKWV